MGFVVEQPGVLTTVQDGGRFGYERFGMSPSGPMDLTSFEIANLLVGNRREESALEMTILGPTLRFTAANVVAVTGAPLKPKLNGEDCPMNRAFPVSAGDELALGAVQGGCRSYIAFAGGLDVPEIMGSRCTALQNKVGGFQGRRLAKGDAIGFRSPAAALPHMERRHAERQVETAPLREIRVVLGPQEDRFTREGIDTFLTGVYTVTKDFDRMGCRLEGPVIAHREDGNIISDGMVTGAIQVPTAGQPIIMLAERQTVGGYTKIATVITADLPAVGQCKAGDQIRFRAVEVEEAHRLLRQREEELQALEAAIHAPEPAAKAPRCYRATVNGLTFTITLTECDD